MPQHCPAIPMTGTRSGSWRVAPIVGSCENDRPHLPLRLPFDPPSKTPTLLSFSPQLILHDCNCDLNRLRKSKQPHNYNKVNGDTEADRQTDTNEAGTIGESGCLQPPAPNRSADCADQLLAYGPDHQCDANAYRAARITDRGYGNEQARHDDRHRDPCGAER